MKIKAIQKIAEKNDVRVSVSKEQGKRVIGLHGFLSDVQAVSRLITGYRVEKADTGYYLYSNRALWE